MKISFGKHLSKSDALVLLLFQEENSYKEPFALLMPSTRTMIKNHLNKPYFKARKLQHFILTPESEPVSMIILVGLGKQKNCTPEIVRKASATGVRMCKSSKLRNINIYLPEEKYTEAILEGGYLADYEFSHYKTQKKNKISAIETLKLLSHKITSKMLEEAKRTEILCHAVAYSRDIVNTPAVDMTPRGLAEEAGKIAKLSSKIKVTIFDKKKLKKLGMGLLLGVGQGSKNDPYLIILEYKNNHRNKKPVALLGKGITFDTGGINLKPTNHIEDMKMDKAGASTVLAIFQALAYLKPDLHVVGVCACAENSITEYATKPGDIHTSYSGKTVEITNTDAEGRLVLGDALAYAVKNYQPEAMVDIATLTGGCIVALGNEITGILGNDQKVIDKVKKAFEQTGEKCWQLPLDPDYEKKVKGTISDLQNYTKGMRGDVIMGAAFLKQFVGKTPWAHLDIAGTAWSSENQYYLSKGATGVPVRSLWRFLENY